MKKVISREEAKELLYNIYKTMHSRLGQIQICDLDDEDFMYQCEGVSNGFLSEILKLSIGANVEVEGEVEHLYKCPCCGWKTLTEYYDVQKGTGYDICRYCGWEDVGITEETEEYVSINKGSIAEYRKRISENPNHYYIHKWLN